MKWSVNTVLQLLATIAQGINAVGELVPEGYHLWVAVALSAIQGVVGVLAHFRNPDGTNVKAPYIPPAKTSRARGG